MSARYNPLCEVCGWRPKMDRCSCCEECWYSGAYAEERRRREMTPQEQREEAVAVRMMLELGIPPGETAEMVMDARRRTGRDGC